MLFGISVVLPVKQMKALFNAKRYLLTFPNVQTEKGPKDLIDNIKKHESFSQLISATIAKEYHQNGTPHFHALLLYKKRKTIRKNDAFN